MTVVVTERGQTYKIVHASTKVEAKPSKVSRVGQNLQVTLEEGSDTAAPTFTAGATVGVAFAENATTMVHTAAATGNVAVVAYAFAAGGADNNKFNLNTATVALTFKVAPDFESPGSAADSNAYTVKVKAVDAAGNEAVQTVTMTMTMTNVNEAPVNTVPNA